MNEVLNAIVAYGPGVAALIGAVVAAIVDIKRTKKITDDHIVQSKEVFDQIIVSCNDEKLQLQEENALLRDMINELKEENKLLRKSLSDLSKRLTHVEFLDK